MRKRDLWILALAFAAAFGTAAWIFFSSVLPTGSWGLSFRREGDAPIGNAGVDQLKSYDAAYIGNTGEKVLYLTFDAGYENGCTAQILDILKAEEVPAAFFLVGNYIEKNADLVRRMATEGHIVGNHTMHRRHCACRDCCKRNRCCGLHIVVRCICKPDAVVDQSAETTVREVVSIAVQIIGMHRTNNDVYNQSWVLLSICTH